MNESCTFYLIILLLLGLSVSIPWMKSEFVLYGKLSKSKSFLGRLQVPKSWFWHFYALGLMCCLVKWRLSLNLILFAVHLMRRVAEELLTLKHRNTIHVGHYVVGLMFYWFTVDVIAKENSGKGLIIATLQLVLFMVASFEQFMHHRILSTTESYGAINTRLFRLVCCPHYFYECLIYFSFFVGGQKQIEDISCLAWVVANLSVTALETKRWNNANFESMKYAMVPFLF